MPRTPTHPLKTLSLAVALLSSTALAAFAGSHGSKTIGETTALIPEAGLATGEIKDGESGNTNFPFASFKALATVGEVDAETGMALTGYPDGQAAWLADENTVRVAYQSESYATMGSAPKPETYPWVMENGVSFTGSHIHTIDFDRAAFAAFMGNDDAAATMVKGSGHLFDTVYNAFGEVVAKPTFDPSDLAGKWGNQTRPDGTLISFKPDFRLSEADYFFQSFCGAWYEEANKYGAGIGFADDIWLAAEEWAIGDMFPAGEADANATMGLAAIAVDIANGTAYTVPALGQTGYEKIMPINSGHEDYVVIVTSGYNHDQEPSPLKVYVGMKDRLPDGSMIDYATAGERDSFLARNGLLFGKLYGMAVSTETAASLVAEPNPAAKMIEEYIGNQDAPATFAANFVPTSYQWGGWDKPVAVQDTEMMLWGAEDEQPEGHIYFNGDSKVEHVAADPSGAPRYFANMTQNGGLLSVDFGAFEFDGEGLPALLPANVTRTVGAWDGALTLELGGEGKVKDGDASIHAEEGVAKMVAPDGLYWAKTADGDYLIVDEDSGNDFGERKYVLSLDGDLNVSAAHLLALAGGKFSSRYEAGVSALGGAFTKGGTAEFSGSWPVTALIAKKDDGSFYSMDELAGTGRQDIRGAISTAEQTFIGVVQARPESSGAVEANGSDAGGQIFMFTMNPTGM
jgi:hypothetical protein